LSEYNHPAPLDAQAECVPMIASFAAAQDWDGVWLFDYSASVNAWSRETLSGFFDIDTNPGKWGFMRAGAALFVQGCLAPLPSVRLVEVAQIPTELPALARLYLKYEDNMLRMLMDTSAVARDDLLRTRLIPCYTSDTHSSPSGPASPAGRPTELRWSVDAAGRGIYQATGEQAQAYTGHAARFEDATEARIRIASPDFVALTITPLDMGDKLLVTACGRCENTDMQFSPDRRTVGRNWGKAPVQIEPVRGRLLLPDGRWTCHALAPDGTPKQPVPVAYENDRGTLTLSPEYGTMWYVLARAAR